MGNIALLQNCFLWYHICMDKNKLLLPDELLSELNVVVLRCGGHAATARTILGGGSAAHLADVLHKRRPISDGMAQKFGYRRRVVYERIQPQREAESADAPCVACGQVAPDSPGIGGEYPCPQCGIPTVHDDSDDASLRAWEGMK